MTLRDACRIGLVLIAFVIVQQAIVTYARVGQVHPDVMVLLPIVAGIAGGPAQGAWMGFASGLVADLFLPTPFGLSALVGTVLGFAVGVVTVALDRSVLWLPPVAGLIGSALYEGSYAVLGSVIGEPQMIHVDLVRIVLLVSIPNAVLAIPALRMVTWALPAASVEGVPTSAVSGAGARR